MRLEVVERLVPVARLAVLEAFALVDRFAALERFAVPERFAAVPDERERVLRDAVPVAAVRDAAASFSRSLSSLLLVFLASACSAFNALVTSPYAFFAPLPVSLASACKAVLAWSSAFSKRLVACSTCRRVVERLEERVVDRPEERAVLRLVLRVAGFLAGGISESPCWALTLS